MKRKFSIVAILSDFSFLLNIVRIHSQEAKEGPEKALGLISQNKYRGIQLGLKNGYHAYLVKISNDLDRLRIVDNLKKDLIAFDGFVLHRSYCLLFIEYIKSLIKDGDDILAKERALAEPASKIYKKILLIPQP